PADNCSYPGCLSIDPEILHQGHHEWCSQRVKLDKQHGGDIVLKRNFICTAGAIALLSGVAMPASADPVTIRVVAKDLLNTNPDDVKLMQKYEDALKSKGTDIKIEIVNLPASGYADKLGAMLLSGDIPDLVYFQGGDQAMSEQGILEDWNTW